MQVRTIRFTDAAGSRVAIEMADGNVLHAKFPCPTWHSALITSWLAVPGNAIAPHQTPPEPTLDQRVAGHEIFGDPVLRAAFETLTVWAGKSLIDLRAAIKDRL